MSTIIKTTYHCHSDFYRSLYHSYEADNTICVKNGNVFCTRDVGNSCSYLDVYYDIFNNKAPTYKGEFLKGLIRDGAINNYDPKVVIDSNNKLHTIFIAYFRESQYVYKYSCKHSIYDETTNTWSEPKILFTNKGGELYTFRLESDNFGNIYVFYSIWESGSGSPTGLIIYKFDGTTWSTLNYFYNFPTDDFIPIFDDKIIYAIFNESKLGEPNGHSSIYTNLVLFKYDMVKKEKSTIEIANKKITARSIWIDDKKIIHIAYMLNGTDLYHAKVENFKIIKNDMIYKFPNSEIICYASAIYTVGDDVYISLSGHSSSQVGYLVKLSGEDSQPTIINEYYGRVLGVFKTGDYKYITVYSEMIEYNRKSCYNIKLDEYKPILSPRVISITPSHIKQSSKKVIIDSSINKKIGEKYEFKILINKSVAQFTELSNDKFISIELDKNLFSDGDNEIEIVVKNDSGDAGTATYNIIKESALDNKKIRTFKDIDGGYNMFSRPINSNTLKLNTNDHKDPFYHKLDRMCLFIDKGINRISKK